MDDQDLAEFEAFIQSGDFESRMRGLWTNPKQSHLGGLTLDVLKYMADVFGIYNEGGLGEAYQALENPLEFLKKKILTKAIIQRRGASVPLEGAEREAERMLAAEKRDADARARASAQARAAVDIRKQPADTFEAWVMRETAAKKKLSPKGKGGRVTWAEEDEVRLLGEIDGILDDIDSDTGSPSALAPKRDADAEAAGDDDHLSEAEKLQILSGVTIPVVREPVGQEELSPKGKGGGLEGGGLSTEEDKLLDDINSDTGSPSGGGAGKRRKKTSKKKKSKKKKSKKKTSKKKKSRGR